MSADRKKSTLLVAILLAGVAATFQLAAQGPGVLGFAPVRAQGPPPPPLVGPGLSVFFTDRTLEGYHGGPETGLIASIDAARAQVDVAAYDLDLWGLRDALIAAHRRGVAVRMVMEAGHMDGEEAAAILAAGIPIVPDLSDGLMHDKFIIIDRQLVWTGSMNFTLNGAYRNDNHLLALRSPEAAQVYEEEFEEMFSDRLFGPYSPPGAGHLVNLEGTDGGSIALEILFSPDDGVAGRILKLLDGARESIHFMAFSFTSDSIGEMMLEKAGEGLSVAGIFDDSQLKSSGGSEYAYFRAASLDVRVDGSPYKLHHKVIIIDSAIVVAGSYNFSQGAETRNDENTVIIYDRAVAERFLAEWQRIFAGSR